MDIPKYDMTLRIVDLQTICKKFKVPYGGTKKDLIERLDRHFKKTENDYETDVESSNESSFNIIKINTNPSKTDDGALETDDDIDSDDVVNDSDEDDCIINKNKKRVRQLYFEEKVFNSVEEAELFVEAEASWKHDRIRSSSI